MNDLVFSQSKDALYNLINETSDIGVIATDFQNADTMGAALALYLALSQAGKNPQIVSKKEPIVEISNLVGIDKVKRNFEGSTKTVVLSIPYKGEVEKVSFTTEEDRMNFNIIGGEHGISPFDLDDVQIIRQGNAPSVIFTIGISRPDDIKDLVDIQSGVKVINIDNRLANTLFGNVVLVDPSFSSLSEIVARIIEELSLPLNVDIAQNLMDGMLFATRNFSSPNTSSFAFEAAGLALRQGAQRRVQPKQPISQPRGSVLNRLDSSSGHKLNKFNPSNIPNSEDTLNITDERVPSDWFAPKVFKGTKQD